MTNASGVYVIKNVQNEKCYVGSAVNFRKRWILHKCTLRKGNHHSPHLQNAWNKYGEDAFVFEVLELTEREQAVSAEQRWMDTLSPDYNMSPTAGSALGTKHTPESKAKIAAAHVGKKHTEATKLKVSLANKGRKHSPEICEKNRLAQTGLKKPPLTAAHKARMSEIASARRRGPHSEETKAKMSATQKGRVFSEETRRKMSEAAIRRRAAKVTQPIVANA